MQRRSGQRGGAVAPPPPERGRGEVAMLQRTAAQGTINRIIASTAEGDILNALTRDDVTVKLRRLRSVWDEYNRHHQIVIGSLQDVDEGAAAEAAVEHLVEACEIRLERRLRGIIEAAAAAVAAANGAMNADRQARDLADRIVVRPVREPKIGKFDGRHENWAAFYDLFRVDVHNRNDLDDLEKMMLLKTACVGIGRKALGEWPITAANYPLAWAALQEKYNDQYALKTRLMTELLNIPKQEEETHNSLRTLQDVPQMALGQQCVELGPSDSLRSHGQRSRKGSEGMAEGAQPRARTYGSAALRLVKTSGQEPTSRGSCTRSQQEAGCQGQTR